MQIHADKETLEFLRNELGRAQKVSAMGDDGVEREYFDRRVYVPEVPAPGSADPLKVSTLRAVADYLTFGEAEREHHFLHIADPATVRLVGRIEEYHRTREVLLEAHYTPPDILAYRQASELEVAVVQLMSCFATGGDRSWAIELLKSVKSEGIEIREDDGLSQAVTVKAGVESVAIETTKNPITLHPFRTFADVEQVPVLTILRLVKGPGVRLIEADGGAWKLEAIARVKAKLEELIPADARPLILS